MQVSPVMQTTQYLYYNAVNMLVRSFHVLLHENKKNFKHKQSHCIAESG